MVVRAVVRGPTGSPYQGGRFRVRVAVPPGYPTSPPSITLTTPTWHPNLTPRHPVTLPLQPGNTLHASLLQVTSYSLVGRDMRSQSN